jgi:cell division initiation protein
MKLTILDIRKKTFKKIMRGYEPEEVSLFLEEVSDYLSELTDTNKQLKKKIESLESEVKILEKIKEEKENDKESENVLKIAEREAEIVKKQAEVKAVEILEKAKADSNRLKEELVTLKNQKNSLLTKLKYTINAHLELIEVLELDENQASVVQPETKTIFKKASSTITEPELNFDVFKKGYNQNDDTPFIKKKKKEKTDKSMVDLDRKRQTTFKKLADHSAPPDLDQIINEIKNK